MFQLIWYVATIQLYLLLPVSALKETSSLFVCSNIFNTIIVGDKKCWMQWSCKTSLRHAGAFVMIRDDARQIFLQQDADWLLMVTKWMRNCGISCACGLRTVNEGSWITIFLKIHSSSTRFTRFLWNRHLAVTCHKHITIVMAQKRIHLAGPCALVRSFDGLPFMVIDERNIKSNDIWDVAVE